MKERWNLEKVMVVSFILFVLLASFTFYSFTLLESGTWDASYIIRSTVTYSNKGTSVWNLTEEDRAVSLFMNNTWQTVNLTYHSYPKENVTVDEDENPIAILQFQSELNPGENISYSVTYQVLSRPRSLPTITDEKSGTLANITEDLCQKYCKGDDTWQIGDQMIREQAYLIACNQTNVLKIVKEFVRWIWQNVTYQSHEIPRYPNQTLLSGKGDCDDQAILLVTFCRILGIPAYLQVGCIYLHNQYPSPETAWEDHITIVSKQIGWHGWAMVYIPPWGWLPVDLTYPKAGFGNPLNAIKTAVVSDVRTIQYMNISETDYVASSRNYQKFIMGNNFYIYAEDEMIRISQESLWESLIERWFQRILIIIVVTTSIIIVVYTYISRAEKTRLKETDNTQKTFIDIH